MSELLQKLRAGDRRSLAKAITLVESQRPEHRAQALELLDALVGFDEDTLRLGISGPPGAGKSTLIDALGMMLLEQGHRIAVLAVDPSSQRSGGSILGDKTRMQRLAADGRAFIRPSPSAAQLGGVARSTRETISLCEVAGFDVVIVETVGVGQSEVAVAGMVDFFALVISPAGGDELQGIKRGVVEICDALWINKADAFAEAAARSQRDYQNALHLFAARDDGWTVPVLQISARTGQGIEEAWQSLQGYQKMLGAQLIAQRRRRQNVQSLRGSLRELLWQQLMQNQQHQRKLSELEQAVAEGQLSPGRAAQQLIENLQFVHRQEP